MKKKVTIEITEKGWTTKVQLGKKTFIEKHVRDEYGAKCIEGDFESDMDMDEDLYYALTSFTQFDVMNALDNVEEPYAPTKEEIDSL